MMMIMNKQHTYRELIALLPSRTWNSNRKQKYANRLTNYESYYQSPHHRLQQNIAHSRSSSLINANNSNALNDDINKMNDDNEADDSAVKTILLLITQLNNQITSQSSHISKLSNQMNDQSSFISSQSSQISQMNETIRELMIENKSQNEKIKQLIDHHHHHQSNRSSTSSSSLPSFADIDHSFVFISYF